MNMQLEKVNNLTPASFGRGGDRTYLQTKYIVALLAAAIKESRVITRDDIINCYIDYKLNGRESFSIREWNYQLQREVLNEYNRNTFMKRLWKPTAIQWFKNNLGAAIIKGRILAIPVIETMENED